MSDTPPTAPPMGPAPERPPACTTSAVQARYRAALARRAAALPEPARQQVLARLAQADTRLAPAAPAPAQAPVPPAPTGSTTAPTPGHGLAALRGLVRALQRADAPEGTAPGPAAAVAADASATTPTPPAAHPELKAVQQFRGTWQRLHAEQKLRQSRAQVPDNAGPLNANRLVHRALALMQAQSPAYLQRFIGQMETLLALDTWAQAAAPGPAAAPAPGLSAPGGASTPPTPSAAAGRKTRKPAPARHRGPAARGG